MNVMAHKPYSARIEYDERDDIFVGRILGIRTMISFHGETVAQLHREFKKAIDDYLADCTQRGVSPERPASGKILCACPLRCTAPR